MAAKPKPKLPLSVTLKLSIGSLLLKLCVRSDGTPNRRIFNLLDSKIPPNSSSTVDDILVSSSDVSIDPPLNLWFRLFVPETTSTKLPLIVYFHGGGFSNFSPDSKACDEFCRILAANIPAVVASVNYRLAPEYKYPCQYEDGFDALKFIDTQNYAVLPDITDLKKCFLAGDSAGGNLAHHVVMIAKQNPEMFDKIVISGLVGLQPFFGGEERTESELRLTKVPIMNVDGADKLWRLFLPEGANRNHPAVCVFGRGDEDAEMVETVKRLDFPACLVIVGGFDPLRDWQKRYVEGLKKCGKEVELIEYPNAFHAFYGFQELPEFTLCIEDIKKFIQKHILIN